MVGNLFDIICDDVTAVDNPVCQECTDKLLDCMDQQMSLLEEECKEYKELLDELKSNQNFPDLTALKSELLNLQVNIQHTVIIVRIQWYIFTKMLD